MEAPLRGFLCLFDMAPILFFFFFGPHNILHTLLFTGTKRCLSSCYISLPQFQNSHHEAERSPATELHQMLAKWVGGWERHREGKPG